MSGVHPIPRAILNIDELGGETSPVLSKYFVSDLAELKNGMVSIPLAVYERYLGRFDERFEFKKTLRGILEGLQILAERAVVKG